MPHRSVSGLNRNASALLVMRLFLVGVFGMLYALAQQQLPSDLETSAVTDDLRQQTRRLGPTLTILGAVALLTGVVLRLVA